MKTKFLGMAAALALCGMISNASAVTVGTANSGNCSLGGCLSGDFVYEQIYSSSAFGNAITFNQIAFFNTSNWYGLTGANFASGSYQISFATTTQPLGADYPVAPLNNVGTFFNGSLAGPVNAQGAYYIAGSNYTYDPSLGNLVLIIAGTMSGPCCSYFDNDNSGAFMSRAYYQAGEGTNADLTGLVTQFSETPLPAALPLFATGLGVLGLLGWRRKRKAAAALAAA